MLPKTSALYTTTHPCRVPAEGLKVRAARTPQGNVGIQAGAQHAGQQRHVSAVAVTRISPADNSRDICSGHSWDGAGWRSMTMAKTTTTTRFE